MKRLIGAMLALGMMAAASHAASCSSTAGNFASWKPVFAAEAKGHGVGG